MPCVISRARARLCSATVKKADYQTRKGQRSCRGIALAALERNAQDINTLTVPSGNALSY